MKLRAIIIFLGAFNLSLNISFFTFMATITLVDPELGKFVLQGIGRLFMSCFGFCTP